MPSPTFDRLTVGDKIIIPRVDQLDPALIEEVPAPAPPVPETVPADEPANLAPLPPAPPPAGMPGPFGQKGTEDPAIPPRHQPAPSGCDRPATRSAEAAAIDGQADRSLERRLIGLRPRPMAGESGSSRPVSSPGPPDRVGQAGG